MGDFNFHINDRSDLRAREFMDLVTSLDFVQHVNGATHNCGNSLDLVFTRRVNADISSIEQTPISDRFCIFVLCLF